MAPRKPNGGERRVFIVTGVSGAGKSQVLKVLEDFDFYCVDNLPIALLDRLTSLIANSPRMKRVALGMDVREGAHLSELPATLGRLKKRLNCRVLFLDAADPSLIARFSETRHRHPLGTKIAEAVSKERRLLTPIKEIADKVIDTTDMTLGELKEAVSQALEFTRTREMTLSIVSFGYKYGLPLDADIVMDVRFLPNPNYVPPLKRRTGLDAPVRRYLMAQPLTRGFLESFSTLIEGLLSHYVKEGKSYLTIAVGCTGGRHRSVFVTHFLAERLKGLGHPVQEFHRDVHH